MPSAGRSRRRRGTLGLALLLTACGARQPGGEDVARREPAPPTRAAEPAPELRPGEQRAERLAAGRPSATFRLLVSHGDFVHVVVEQRGIDLVATLFAPGGRPLHAVDSPNGAHGPEHLFHVAAQSGEHVLEVRPFAPSPDGEFAISLVARRQAAPDDRLRAEASRAVSDGDAALARDLAETRREAVRLYTRAHVLWERTGERYPAMIARMKLGRALYRDGQTRRAVEQWEAALRTAGALGVEAQVAPLRNDLGLAYQRLDETARARAAFEAALAQARATGDLREETVTLNNLALLEGKAGEPWLALLLLDEALANWRALGEKTSEATALHNLGTLLTSLGRFPEARDALEEALRLHHAAGNRRHEASTAMALGWVRCVEGDFARGRRDLLRSLALRREIGDRRGEAVTLDRLGSASREAGRPERAVREYEAALAIVEHEDDRRSEAHTLSNLGDALIAAGDPAAGRARLDAALRFLAAEGDPSSTSYAHFRRAKAKRALGDLGGARADLVAALALLESVRARAESVALRTSYLASAHEQYELAIDLAMELHEREPRGGHDHDALGLAESARARGLLDLLAEAKSGGAVAAAFGGDGGLRRLDRAIHAAAAPGAPADAARLRRLLLEREKAIVALRHGHSGAGRGGTPVLDGAAIRKELLDRDTLLLIYALGERRSFVWCVTTEAVHSAVLPARPRVVAAVERLLPLTARPPGLATATQARLVAEEVARLLLAPVARHLGDRRLAIAADGVLARVPFAALPDPRGGSAALIERHEIVMLPSASTLATVRRRAQPRTVAPGPVAVVADPIFRSDDPRLGKPAGARPLTAAALASATTALTRSARDLGLRGLARVPFTRQEAAAIAALARGGRALSITGAAATRDLVVGGGLRGYPILHFATHALLHPEQPELSGLVLSLYGRDGRPRNGFLRSYEIARLDLPAQLVVLSACRTGGGKEVRGEGLVGLTQSFFEAGAARVVASLWDVDDEATARLMARFYGELIGGGRSPAAALRAAQRELRAEPRWAAPYYWAGFILAGDWLPLTPEPFGRVSLDSSFPRVGPGSLDEEGTMDSSSIFAATREGGTPGGDDNVKADKGVKPQPTEPAKPASGSEPEQDDTGKGTSKGV